MVTAPVRMALSPDDADPGAPPAGVAAAVDYCIVSAYTPYYI